MGYYVHLLTDVLWNKEFVPNFATESKVTDLEGNVVKLKNENIMNLIYNDYSNVNRELLSYYNMDLSLFYEPFEITESHIEEVPSLYFGQLINKLGVICKQSEEYSYLFDMERISHFIYYATIYCLDEINKLKNV